MTESKPEALDRHDIKAKIAKAGLTMEAIAEKAGLKSWQVRHGLRGNNKTGAQAIAKALGLPFRTLFPDSYVRRPASKGQATRKAMDGASQNTHVDADHLSRAS